MTIATPVSRGIRALSNAEMERSQARVRELVSQYTPEPSYRYQVLYPLRDSIAELRRMKASYRRIAAILKKGGVAVSHDTVYRFCREVLEGAPAMRQKSRRKPRPRNRRKDVGGQSSSMTPKLTQRAAEPQSGSPPEAPAERPSAAMPEKPSGESSATRQRKGPRIANPSEI